MAQTHDTIADIIAEMRRGTKLPGYWHSCDVNKILQYHADRLDAAYKRELDALNEQITVLRQQRDLWSKRSAELVERCNEHYAKLKQVGNAAKLREALISVQKKIHYLIGSLNVPNSLVANRMEINGTINAALASPARNCDVHTAEKLKAIFKSELVSELPMANEHEKNLITITANVVIDTLFAPAAEKEGGNK